jgi:hypothetical protein
VTEDLKELLRLYAAEQECSPDDQARCAKDFSSMVKTVAKKHSLHHWDISAYVRKQHEKQRLAEERRAGKSKGAGLQPIQESDQEKGGHTA